MKDKDSVKLLLETIQEIYNSSNDKTIVSYKDYEWYMSFQDIKQLDNNGKYVKFYNGNDTEKIFSIIKPIHESCPVPDDKLSEWLKRGWERYQNRIETIEMINDENFSDDENRIATFEEWNNQRQIWVDEEYRKEKLLELFNRLSKIIDDFKLDYDKQELLVSAGVISTPQIDKKVAYPLLTQKVNIKFDNDINTAISIYFQETEVNVETKFLSELENIVKRYKENNPTDLKIINNRVPEILGVLSENDINILNKNETEPLLKRVLTLLTDNGKFIDDTDVNEHSEEYFLIKYYPIFIYRNRTVGLDDFIAQINNSINVSPNKIPNHFINLLNGNNFIKSEQVKDLTVKEKIAKISGTFEDVLLTKPSNQEQLRIIHEINRNDVVEVQGPPGTGKTHTIANLLGHFLAQGKRVLVVSEKTKALEVIQDKLEPEIRDLCVPVLYGNNEKLKKAINGILHKNASESLTKLKREADELNKQRKDAIHKLHELQFKLFNIRNEQTEKILFRQQYYSPIEIGRFIADNSDKLSLIPGNISRMDEMPINQQEIQTLFTANNILTPTDEKELTLLLPSIDELLNKETAEELFKKHNTIKKEIAKIATDLNEKAQFIDKKLYINEQLIFSNPETEQLDALKTFIKELPELDDLTVTVCLADRQSKGYAETWKMLSNQIEQYLTLENEYITLSYTTSIQINNSVDINKLSSSLDSTIQKYAGKSGFGFWGKFFDDKLKYVLSNIQINNNDIKNIDDCTLVKKCLLVEKCKIDLRSMWNKSFKEISMPSFDEITILKVFENVKKQIDSALVWFDEIYTPLIAIGERAHINSALISFDNDEYRTEEFKSYYNKLKNIIVSYIDIAKNYIDLSSIEENVNSYANTLNKESVSCEKLFQALTSFNYENYCNAYDNYIALLDKRNMFNDKKTILKKLYPVAKDWAKTFDLKNDISLFKDVDFDLAWKVKQFKMILDDIYEYSEDELVDKINNETTTLYKITTKLVCTQAWFHNLSYCQQDSSILPALNNYIRYNKKIGAGKGKYANDYRKAAQQSMSKCQQAVPAWIMSVSEAINRFNPTNNHFDIMIIDEASQSSLNVLILTYLADKLIVVGDDKQVSPLAIGNDMQRQQDIVNKKLRGILKEPQLFRTDTSFYDLMANVSVPIMLCEHFRCMPAIIGYCNKYFYDGKICPLRDGNNNSIKPSIINFPVKGERDSINKINNVEAKTIVAIIKSCLELEEYRNKTFGVISLLGKEQSEYIRQMLSEKIGSKVMEEHNIICGEAPSFQGDERDIILLSMVDDQNSVRTVTKTGNRGATGQRYNVAVSRAKDQVWIVNSLNYNLLKKDDIRHELLDYAEHSDEYLLQKEKIAQESDSPFEEEVASYLVDHGYHIKQQYLVGSYRIDIVVFYQNNRIAIECDGERYHSGSDKVLADMEREEILRRIGNWKFIRIRGGRYYENKKFTMENVLKQLEKNNIYPENNIPKENDNITDSLFGEIKKRIEQKLLNWDNWDKLEVEHTKKQIKTNNITVKKDTDLKNTITKININKDTLDIPNLEQATTEKVSLEDVEKVIFKLISSNTWFDLSKYKWLNPRSKNFAYNMAKKDINFEPSERQLKFAINILKSAKKSGFKFDDDISNIIPTP